MKSPSVYDALARKQPFRLKEKVLSKGGRFVISDGEKDSVQNQPIPPKNNIRIHLGQNHIERLFKRNKTNQESDISVETPEHIPDPPPELTL